MEVNIQKIEKLMEQNTYDADEELVLYLKHFMESGTDEQKKLIEPYYHATQESISEKLLLSMFNFSDSRDKYQALSSMLSDENQQTELKSIVQNKETEPTKSFHFCFAATSSDELMKKATTFYAQEKYSKAEKICKQIIKKYSNRDSIKAHEMLANLYCSTLLKKDSEKLFQKGIEHALLIKDESDVECYIAACHFDRNRDYANAIKYWIKDFKYTRYVRDLSKLANAYKKNQHKKDQEDEIFYYYKLFYDQSENLKEVLYQAANESKRYFDRYVIVEAEKVLGINSHSDLYLEFYNSDFVLPFQYQKYDNYNEMKEYLNTHNSVSLSECMDYLDKHMEIIQQRTEERFSQALDIAMRKHQIAEAKKQTYLMRQQQEMQQKNEEMKRYHLWRISSELNSIKWRL